MSRARHDRAAEEKQPDWPLPGVGPDRTDIRICWSSAARSEIGSWNALESILFNLNIFWVKKLKFLKGISASQSHVRSESSAYVPLGNSYFTSYQHVLCKKWQKALSPHPQAVLSHMWKDGNHKNSVQDSHTHIHTDQLSSHMLVNKQLRLKQ